MTWTDWARWFGISFGYHSAQDECMLTEWAALLDCQGYLPQEADVASRQILADMPPQHRSQALRALKQQMGINRLRQRLAEEFTLQDDSWVCEKCGGSGLVIVPHFRFVRDGRWWPVRDTFYTVGLACDCKRGERRKERFENGSTKTMMTLAEYLLKVPHWQDLIREQVEAQNITTQILKKAERLDAQDAFLAVQNRVRPARTAAAS